MQRMPRMSEPRRATIEDVAARAGVSVSAVSKVLRDAYGVSPRMRERVTSAIEELRYRPHAGARGMRGRSYTIGVMLVELTSPFQVEVAAAITESLQTTPYQDIIVTGGVTPERHKRAIEALIDRQVDGLILIAPQTKVEWIEEIAGSLPTVVVALHGASAHFDTVVDDDKKGAQIMVDHLVDLGHRNIVHTSMSGAKLRRPFALSHTARRDGYEHAMRRNGLQPDVIVTSYTEEGGYDAACQALDRTEPPTAIFAGADIAALGVLRAAEERGLRVPHDLAVAGYDNIYVSTIKRISLTTVDQSGRITGATSTRLLLERIDGRIDPAHSVIPPQLIIRATSGPAPRRRTDTDAEPGIPQPRSARAASTRGIRARS
jgi:LacI family transcriptional regulator